MSLVIQPGRVSSQRLRQIPRGKEKEEKSPTEGETDPDLAGFAAGSNGDGWRGRKEENGNGMKGNEETREPRRKSKSRKNKVTAGELVPGHAGSLERFQPCARPSAQGCDGLIASGVKSDSRFWYLLRKSFGGIPWLADRKGRKQQQ